MADARQAPCGDDICAWPDGTWCYAWDLEGMLQGRSDDFERIPFDTPSWHAFPKE